MLDYNRVCLSLFEDWLLFSVLDTLPHMATNCYIPRVSLACLVQLCGASVLNQSWILPKNSTGVVYAREYAGS